MDSGLRGEYLAAMGIQQWIARDAVDDSPVGPDWAGLEAQVAACTQCSLHETRTQTVFGTGNRDADWLIIGEAPGADEDRQGEPFVGRAGQLLNEMLFAVGYRRPEVYIANILKCRPPANRNPRPEEMACCQPWLQQQIEWINPRLILAVGGIAAHNLLQTDEAVGRLRGIVHRYGKRQIPLVVTYHPAYLLRSPREKRKVWADLQFAQQVFYSND
jgi:DNA polymerase